MKICGPSTFSAQQFHNNIPLTMQMGHVRRANLCLSSLDKMQADNTLCEIDKVCNVEPTSK